MGAELFSSAVTKNRNQRRKTKRSVRMPATRFSHLMKQRNKTAAIDAS